MKQPLPGLEHEARTLEGLAPYRSQVWKQSSKQITTAALAERLTGGRVALDWTSDGLMLEESNPDEDAGPGESLASRFAALLMLSAQDDNHAVGQFDGSNGETFAGGAVLWKSSLRLDPTWMEAMRRRTRNTARARLKAMRDQLKEHLGQWKAYLQRDRTWAYRDIMMTLTMNKIPGACSVDEVRRFNTALRFMFKGDYWRSLVTVPEGKTWPIIFGGIKAIEDALTDEGPHVHGHFLMISRFLNQDQLHEAWTAAVRKATRNAYGLKFAQTFTVNLPYLQMVTKRAKKKDQITHEKALDEVCKYLTKPGDLLTPHINRAGRQVNPPPPDVLLALCMVQRWPRMFELFGAARKPSQAKPEPSLDTSCISVPGPAVPLPEFWEEGAIEPEEWFDFREKIAEAARLSQPRPPDKAPSWRQLMYTMGLHDWLQAVASRYRRGIAFRKRWLRTYNPHLDLITLSGEKIISNPWPEYDSIEVCLNGN